MIEDNNFMLMAIDEALLAFKEDEVPIGAIITLNGKVVGRGHNIRNKTNNAIDHAEILAISDACKNLGRWILDDCTIYVTSEPCLMCAGAISQARIKKIVYGVSSPKYGVCESVDHVFDNELIFHNIEMIKGIEKEKIENMMKEFFKHLR